MLNFFDRAGMFQKHHHEGSNLHTPHLQWAATTAPHLPYITIWTAGGAFIMYLYFYMCSRILYINFYYICEQIVQTY